ncbi:MULTISPECIES: electron transfer flavoprotein subunit beta/FixA family protein [Psychrilyobacter]|uniref:Electron transfer flavoprotein subunit beta/FixA family protein n=1 Tax=Psychrilyobacter piezotolerans TaxID=2293438 RepID=A0ABX9KE40_9FUSO|nr:MULTISPECIES: electron transfer flavoprotein subunit beta/FixA family protein [Psychrilyobacter]MCS5422434.1 electron transfer flavoprotein subunit beta/FixA family protein [Psychrilyobacter sp. S5]NDI79067.1 electron transfer flavoprotein subunit beta/FixA family protein [Psychrilyobacter piezotolerans]RDE59027.1 electron transfer flavoprotein subunit beta/FixA family protein [Psychrilyobacter sp. S5]REI39604.1 electron transfer flavoprotein subunit beta/FixA family protein [Psychrilyobacte
MNIICLIKFVPNIDKFKYNYETNTLIRDGINMILNPHDSCAVELALQLKDKNDDVSITVVTMGSMTALENLKDVVRRGIDKGVLISDKSYAGSDSYVTSTILSEYLKKNDYDLILSGSRAQDGDTGHVGPQVASLLDINQFSDVTQVENIRDNMLDFKVELEDEILTLNSEIPILLSLKNNPKYKLRYPRYKELKKDVTDRIDIIDNKYLSIANEMIGLKGSPTKVIKAEPKQTINKAKKIVKCDNEGIDYVYNYLLERGFIKK